MRLTELRNFGYEDVWISLGLIPTEERYEGLVSRINGSTDTHAYSLCSIKLHYMGLPKLGVHWHVERKASMKEQAKYLTKKPYEAPQAEIFIIEMQGIMSVSDIQGNSTESVGISHFAFP